jgi:hypothetical protein
VPKIVCDEVAAAPNGRDDNHPTFLTLELLDTANLDLVRDAGELPPNLLHLRVVGCDNPNVVVG